MTTFEESLVADLIKSSYQMKEKAVKAHLRRDIAARDGANAVSIALNRVAIRIRKQNDKERFNAALDGWISQGKVAA